MLFFQNLERRAECELIKYKGIFRRKISLAEGVALLISGTVGAGVLGIPYAVAKVGVVYGLIYVVVLGLLMAGLHLLLAEVAASSCDNLQMVGLARTHLGKAGGLIMAVLSYVTIPAAMVVYIIGGGESLAALLGGSSFVWSIIFWAVGTFLVVIGLRMIKVVDVVLSIGLLSVISIVSLMVAPHIRIEHMMYNDFAQLLFPYGVILFAFSGAAAIPETHALLKGDRVTFKKAIIISSVLMIVLYAVFAFAVVGVTGRNTTEIATIGLGNALGDGILLLGNIFAILAMGSGFLMGGVSVKDSLKWDYKFPPRFAGPVVCTVPLVIFLLGLRSFIGILDIVGGVLVSIELLLVTLIYWRARSKGLLLKRHYLHHALLLASVLLIAFTVGAVYSVAKLF